MGYEARVKAARRAERRQTVHAEAWARGENPTTQLTEDQYKAVVAAMIAAEQGKHAIQVLMQEIGQQLADALRAAGLQPHRTYKLNHRAKTAELVG